MDDIRPILRLIGTLAMLGAGLFSLLAPRTGARLMSIEVPTGRAVTELRVLGGGFFVGIGVWALLANTVVAYQLLGVGWLGGAISRLVGLIADKPKIDRTFVVYWVLEISMSLFLLV
jgi:hypothetical protein